MSCFRNLYEQIGNRNNTNNELNLNLVWHAKVQQAIKIEHNLIVFGIIDFVSDARWRADGERRARGVDDH